MTDPLHAIPADRRGLAADALSKAFGDAQITAVAPITGGASGALIYRVEAAGRAGLLRLDPPRGPFTNPVQHAAIAQAAAAGIAPALRRLDAAAGVMVMDFLPTRPLADYPGGPEALVPELGRLIARLQRETDFPPLADYVELLERLLGQVAAAGLFAPGLLDPHLQGFARLHEAWSAHPSPPVSSHNDPNPGNILWDGGRLWLIDWETAYRNDPLIDLAVIAENHCPTPELETALLTAWGGPPSPLVRARLTLARALTRLYYAGIVLGLFAGAPPETPDADLTALTPAELQAEVAAGRMTIGAPPMMYALGKMLLAGFLDAIRAPGFDDALEAARRG